MNLQSFQNPPKKYREVPFWSWNDDLDPQELVRQVGLMDEAGWGGFFMHSRVGLITPYMGQKWIECIRACVEAARERSMGAWLYDEDRWPSGYGGGLSVAQDPAFRVQYLVCKVDDRPAFIAERIATFSAREVDGKLTNIRPDDAPDLSEGDRRVVQFYPQTMPLGAEWFNDYAYVSLLNPRAVRAFLNATHEVYARTFGDDFGAVVPGIFTDEPCMLYSGHGVAHQPAVPWTDDFAAYFAARNGYDLLAHLPALFFDTGDYRGVRYDFWRTITERYVESFTRQVCAWCDAHHLPLTGHVMAEDTLQSQITWVGAAMPHYPYMHIPGIDKLGRVINERAGTVLTFKQLDSVVCQLGKPRALCENYGCSGQDFAHTGRKWVGDWSYVLGITLHNPHLSLYSMRGERKRDFPQNLFYQQPWWPENRLIADYFARLSYALSQGQRVVDLMVIHPIGSAWARYRPNATYAVGQLDRALDDLLQALMRNHRDFHLADEMLIEPGGACEATVAAGEDGPRLEVGRMAYRLVIVPPMDTLAESTARLLGEFAAAGGTVLALEPRPTLVGGRPVEGPVLPETASAVTLDALPGVLDEQLPFDVRIPGRPAIWAHHRRVGPADIYFLANTDLDAGGVATVQLRGAGRLEAWDPATGLASELPSRQSGGVTEVTLDFPPAGSQLLVLHRDQSPVALNPTVERVALSVRLHDAWELALGGPNALTLDTAQVRLGQTGARWGEPRHVLDAHGAVAQAGVGTPFALRFHFDVSERPAGEVFLVIESPERFDITVNGERASNDDAGWWTDISFRKVDIRRALQAGRNEVVLAGRFARDTELESIYLVGDFGVAARRQRRENVLNGQVFDRYAPEFQVTSLPGLVGRGRGADGAATGEGPDALSASRGWAGDGPLVDLTRLGLPFFAGRARLRQTVTLPLLEGRVVLALDGLRAAAAHVRANGRQVGTIAWPPHQVEITGALHPGENEIEIELVGTLRNLLGPHHLRGGDLAWTGPREFRDKNRWTDDYILVPFGLDGATLTAMAPAGQ